MLRQLLLLPLASAIVTAAMTSAAPAQANTIEAMFSRHTQGSRNVIDHAPWDRLLKRFIVAGSDGLNRVAYRRFKAEAHEDLKTYIRSLESVRVTGLDRREQFAFWANLYNAKTIDVVLDGYPLKSIRDINLGGGLFATLTGGPWKAKIVKVEGRDLSLDDIEHGILRPIFKDPRVHYAVNCASVGCPNLMPEAFTGPRLDQQLDAGARAYVNSPRGFVFSGANLYASSIYNWFQVDFGGTQQGVLQHAIKYAEPELKARLAAVTGITNYNYDWSLNDARN